ncbi:hypothetical protein K439DRAFT_291702 [Ramaria rubella]|nr:hypothetical protein K439DRAFT_291702 [Ramaria rubella]
MPCRTQTLALLPVRLQQARPVGEERLRMVAVCTSNLCLPPKPQRHLFVRSVKAKERSTCMKCGGAAVSQQRFFSMTIMQSSTQSPLMTGLLPHLFKGYKLTLLTLWTSCNPSWCCHTLRICLSPKPKVHHSKQAKDVWAFSKR